MKHINWICLDCGNKHGNREVGLATWHDGTCDVCGERKAVTEPRDFGCFKNKKFSIVRIVEHENTTKISGLTDTGEYLEHLLKGE